MQPNPADTTEWGGNKAYRCQCQDMYEGQQTTESQSKTMEQPTTSQQSTNTHHNFFLLICSQQGMQH